MCWSKAPDNIRWLFAHANPCDVSLTLLNAGIAIAASIPITTIVIISEAGAAPPPGGTKNAKRYASGCRLGADVRELSARLARSATRRESVG